jgi:hypothetical protein
MEYFLFLLEKFGANTTATGLIIIAIKLAADRVIRFIKEGSKDVSHEHAVSLLTWMFEATTENLGLKIRKIQSDRGLVGKPMDIAYQFNSLWQDKWKRMLKLSRGATYKGAPLEIYIHSTINAWTEKRAFLLDCLLEQMSNPNAGSGKVDSLEDELLRFQHNLEFGADIWLETGVLYQEEPKPKSRLKKLLEKKEIEEPKAEVPQVEVAGV